MMWSLAAIISNAECTAIVACVAALLVLMCLKTLGAEFDNATRWHNLKVETHTLRLKQLRRIRELDPTRHRGE